MKRQITSYLLSFGLAVGAMVQGSPLFAAKAGDNEWRKTCHTVTLQEVQGPFEGLYGAFLTSKVEKYVNNTACDPLNEWTLLMVPSTIHMEATAGLNPNLTFSQGMTGLVINTPQEAGTYRQLLVISTEPLKVGGAFLSQSGLALTGGLIQAAPAPSVAFGPPRSVIDPNNNLLNVEFANGFNLNRFAVSSNSESEVTAYTALLSGDQFVPKTHLTESVDFADYLPPIVLDSNPSYAELTGSIEMDDEDNTYTFMSRTSLDLQTNPRLHVIATSADGVSSEAVEVIPDDSPNHTQLFLGTAIDGKGVLHVVTDRLGDSTDPTAKVLYTRSEDGGETWSEPLVFESPVGVALYPSVAVDKNGQRVAISYFGQSYAGEAEQAEIRVAVSDNGGESFSSNVQVRHGTLNPSINPYTKVVVDKTHTIYLSGADDIDLDGFGDIFVMRSENGLKWSGASMANQRSTGTSSVLGNMGVGPKGEIDVVYNSDPDGDGNLDVYNHSRSVDGGVTFSTAQTLASGSQLVAMHRGIRYDVNGDLHVQFGIIDLNQLDSPSTVLEVIGR